MTTHHQPKLISIYAIDESGNNIDQLIAQTFPASQEAVDYVLEQPEGDDGRSEWRWFILQNGDWILGLFPTGDAGFFGTELWRDADYKAVTS